MKHNYKLFTVLFILIILLLTLSACGSPEPPSEALVTDLLNQRDSVEGEYTFQNMNECQVEFDEPDGVEAWGIFYTRSDVEGSEKEYVRILKNTDGEWLVTDKEHCQIR